MSDLGAVHRLEIRDERYDGPTATSLIAALQDEYVERYGGPDDSPVEPAQFAPPQGLFIVGYLDAVPVAMGGLRRHDDAAGAAVEVEIKRMYVAPAARGRGLSRVILAALEDRARGLGAARVVLESGEAQPEALSLYRTSGYTEIEGFGYYKCAPLSRSFAKRLG